MPQIMTTENTLLRLECVKANPFVCGALDCYCNVHAYDSIMMDDVRLKAMNIRDECMLAAG